MSSLRFAWQCCGEFHPSWHYRSWHSWSTSLQQHLVEHHVCGCVCRGWKWDEQQSPGDTWAILLHYMHITHISESIYLHMLPFESFFPQTAWQPSEASRTTSSFACTRCLHWIPSHATKALMAFALKRDRAVPMISSTRVDALLEFMWLVWPTTSWGLQLFHDQSGESGKLVWRVGMSKLREYIEYASRPHCLSWYVFKWNAHMPTHCYQHMFQWHLCLILGLCHAEKIKFQGNKRQFFSWQEPRGEHGELFLVQRISWPSWPGPCSRQSVPHAFAIWSNQRQCVSWQQTLWHLDTWICLCCWHQTLS